LAVVAAVVLAAAVPAAAQSLTGNKFFAVDENNHKLYCYDFNAYTGTWAGRVVAVGNKTLNNIRGLAYVPGGQNIYGFWNDSTDHLARIVYINTADGSAQLLPGNLGSGLITGAAAVPTSVGSTVAANQKTPFEQKVKTHLYVVQIYLTVSGRVNLNPNNSADNEFTLTKPDGSIITRDVLQAAEDVPSDGTFYFGDAVNVRFKPKGNGNQNTIVLNGAPYWVENSHTYLITGNLLTVRLYNDKVNKNGKAMGQWWMELASGNVTIDDLGESGAAAIDTDNGHDVFGTILRVNPANGVTKHVMPLSRFYDDIAGFSADKFYLVANDRVYVADPALGTEIYLCTIGYGDVDSLVTVGSMLYGYSNSIKRLIPINPTTGSVGTPINVGNIYTGDIEFMRHPDTPASKNND
jgi:hypothetical protein